MPWRSLASATALGTPMGIGALHPIFGEIIAVSELTAGLTIIGTALFGSADLCDRAFRLLRWMANRPEPPAPAGATERTIGPVTESECGGGVAGASRRADSSRPGSRNKHQR